MRVLRGRLWSWTGRGAGGRGWKGGKTCPISAPLPDLMLALPFSSPCLLQAPCFSVTAVGSTVLVQGSRSLCCKGQVKGPPRVQHCQGVLTLPETLPLLGLGLSRFRGVAATTSQHTLQVSNSSGETRAVVREVKDSL